MENSLIVGSIKTCPHCSKVNYIRVEENCPDCGKDFNVEPPNKAPYGIVFKGVNELNQIAVEKLYKDGEIDDFTKPGYGYD